MKTVNDSSLSKGGESLCSSFLSTTMLSWQKRKLVGKPKELGGQHVSDYRPVAELGGQERLLHGTIASTGYL